VHEVISAGADGAIVGSAIVDLIAKSSGDEGKMLSGIRGFVGQLKEATRT
jgi:tryptophan synthase alpha chain